MKRTNLLQQIELLYNEFCKEHGHEPRYAKCEIEWQDDHNTSDVVFKLSCDVTESEADQIFFYCNSVKDLQSMTEKGMEDYVISKVYSFENELLRS